MRKVEGCREVDYLTIPAVELVTVGMRWPAMSGPVALTLEHLADMLAAFDDPHILPPRVKIGHYDPRFNAGPDHDPFNQDGAPALGRAANPRLDNDGAVLVADLIEVPAWLAEAAPSAYPSRSCEWAWAVTTPGDRQYSAVLTAIGFLGLEMPAIGDLEDLERVLTEGPDAVAAARCDGGDRVPVNPAASVSADRVRQAFNWEWATSDPVDGQDTYYWWARDIRLDPDEVIADDDIGHLWTVPFTTDGQDTVTFGEPERVRVTYVPVSEPAAAARAASERHGQRVAASALARPDKPRPNSAATRPDPSEEDANMAINLPALRVRLGLADDATEEQINEALARAEGSESEQPPADGEQPPVTSPVQETAAPETVAVAASVWAETQAQARDGAAARRAQLDGQREGLIDAAVRAGRCARSDAEGWRAYATNHSRGLEAGVAALRERLEALTPGLIPVDEIGVTGSSASESATHQSIMASGFGLVPAGVGKGT